MRRTPSTAAKTGFAFPRYVYVYVMIRIHIHIYIYMYTCICIYKSVYRSKNVQNPVQFALRLLTLGHVQGRNWHTAAELLKREQISHFTANGFVGLASNMTSQHSLHIAMV